MLYSKNLYDSVLLNPFKNENVSKLTVITGYSHPSIVDRHFKDIDNDRFNLKLLIGMGNTSLIEHRTYKQMMVDLFPERFECYYIKNNMRVHSKLYNWSNDTGNNFSILGSANYSQNGLITNTQKELLYKINNDNSEMISQYLTTIFDNSIICTDENALELIRYGESIPQIPDVEVDLQNGMAIEIPPVNNYLGYRISLLKRNGDVPQRSNLNWGQRPDQNREPNQAYIRVPKYLQDIGFFPDRYKHFIIQDISDEDLIFMAVRAQDNGKAIHSTENNSIIGTYFRNKVGVNLGNPIKLNDLINYGKTYVDFYKVDDETFLIDF